MRQACLPLPLQIVIDDVGWWCGDDTSAANGPYRSGCPRPHAPADYQAIAELGRRLGMRPQAAMILGEWDRDNLLRGLPTSQWQGAQWDNSQWVGPWLDETAEIITGQADHLEVVLHGVGHEYWTEGVMGRAEWHDRQGRMRPRDQVERHLDAFAALLERNRLGAFPQSFVPAAFLHRFGADHGLAEILGRWGVRYCSTPFAGMFRDRDTEGEDWGLDHGLITVDRGRDLNNWDVIAPEPQGEIPGPICGMHWPNVLHPDPQRYPEVVDRWVQLLEPYRRRPDRMLAPDTAAGFSQLLYCRRGKVEVGENQARVDLTALASLPAPGLRDSFYVKMMSPQPPVLSVTGADLLTTEPVPGTTNQYLLHLRRRPGQWQCLVSWPPLAQV